MKLINVMQKMNTLFPSLPNQAITRDDLFVHQSSIKSVGNDGRPKAADVTCPNGESVRRSCKKLRKYPCLVHSFLTHLSQGQLTKAVNTLPLLSSKGIRLNSKLIASLIQQCANSKSHKQGKLVHLHLKITGSKHPDTYLANHLINMYAKCGDHVKAREVFDKMGNRNLYSWNNMLSGYACLGMVKATKRLFDVMPERDVVSWNTVVMGYVETGLFYEALRFYKEFRRAGVGFSEFSFTGVLSACVKLRDVWLVRQLHCQVCGVGFLSNVVISSLIVDVYAKCGELGDARRLFEEMTDRDVLTWNSLVSGYAKCGEMESARNVFDEMTDKNTGSWNALIVGYAQNRMGRDAIRLFLEMIGISVEPDQFTFSSCLLACATETLLVEGRQFHSHLIKADLRLNVVVLSYLIEMYSKCGKLDVAKSVFDAVQDKEHVLLWNTIISALARDGFGRQAMKMFIDMVRLGVKPDNVTFLVTLDACNNSQLVQEGVGLFDSMIPDYNIIPDQEHYACLIDLLGSSGRFDDVMSQLKKMPFKADDRVWNALFRVCRNNGSVELGKIAARHLVELEPRSHASYLLLSSIYASLGKWEYAEEVRKLMKEKDLEKGNRISWLEIDGQLHLDSLHSELHICQLGKNTVQQLLADQTSS